MSPSVHPILHDDIVRSNSLSRTPEYCLLITDCSYQTRDGNASARKVQKYEEVLKCVERPFESTTAEPNRRTKEY